MMMNKDDSNRETRKAKRQKIFISITYLLYCTIPLISYLIFALIVVRVDKTKPVDLIELFSSVFAIFFTFSSICFSWKRSIDDKKTKEYVAVSEAAYYFFGAALFLVFATGIILGRNYFNLNSKFHPIIFAFLN